MIWGAGPSVGSSAAAASARFPNVADKPHVRDAGASERIRESHNCSNTPLLLPINSCHSSTTIQRTLPNTSALSA